MVLNICWGIHTNLNKKAQNQPTLKIPAFEEVIINKMTEQKKRIVLHISMPQKEHTCPDCGQKTDKVHDYRIQKIKHFKWFERLPVSRLLLET